MMSTDHLIQILKEAYESAPFGEKKTTIHLFGIKFSSELENHSVKEIAESATGRVSYQTEISVGMRLAKHVTVKT